MATEKDNTASKAARRHGRSKVGVNVEAAPLDSARVAARIKRLRGAIAELQAREEPPAEKIAELQAELVTQEGNARQIVEDMAKAIAGEEPAAAEEPAGE